jgi:hypothetical protein
MHFTIQRANGLYYKGSNPFDPWTASAELATQFTRADAVATARELRAAAKRAGVPQSITVCSSALELARAFSRRLQATLTARELAEAIALNKVETSPDVCHSHDYCDANMVMLDALADLMSVGADDVDLEGSADLMNRAHNIAYANHFFTAE